MTVPAADVAVELERLRGTVTTGFARVEGSLAVLVEQSNRNKEDVRQLREDTNRSLAELDQRLTLLERTRWPLPAVAALTGVGALAVSVWSALGR